MPLPPHAEQTLLSLADPLLDRARIGRPALGLAYYPGERLDRRWMGALDQMLQARGFFAEHLTLSELGDAPVKSLLSRQRVTDHLFTIEITPSDLPDAALTLHTAVAQLNIQRDTLRDEKLALILWIPASHARRFADLASNLSDYRTVDVDLPALTEQTVAASPPHAAQSMHNLPFTSIGGEFIGREAEITALRRMLVESGASAITDALAVEGLGGMGKTRLALEYAYRHLADYPFVFFLRADDPSTVRSELGRLVDLSLPNLSLPPDAQDDTRCEAALAWLVAHPGWLLIFDNADAEAAADYLAEEILPRLRGRGHLLLTTRYVRWGGQVQALKLDSLTTASGVDYLLRTTSASRPALTSDPYDAQRLVEALDGLPLALEQAAAWVNQHHSSLQDALANLQQEDASLLSWYDPAAMRYPLPVAALWQRTLENLSATERSLIRLLAWLAPLPVPDFLYAAAEKLDLFKEQDVPQLIRGLESRSVLKARSDRSTQLHRLHHELERRRTPEKECAEWHSRVIQMLAKVVPFQSDDVRTWPRMRLLEAHVENALSLTKKDADSVSAELTWLLNQLGLYYYTQALHSKAEPLFRRALLLDEASFGADHPKVAIDLNNLATLLQATNRLAEAEEPMRRALKIDESNFGPGHPNVARDLNNLAQLLQATNRLAEAEEPMRRALKIDEASFGPDHPKVAIRLNNLGRLLQDTNRLEEAEESMRRGMTIFEKNLGKDHPNVATALNNIAMLFQETNRLAEAEEPMRRALRIDEASFGPDHPNVAIRLNNLASLLHVTNRLAEAVEAMRRSLVLFARFTAHTGHVHPHLRIVMNNYYGLLLKKGLPEPQAAKTALSALTEGGMTPEQIQQVVSS